MSNSDYVPESDEEMYNTEVYEAFLLSAKNIHRVLDAEFDPGEGNRVYSELQTFRGSSPGKVCQSKLLHFFFFCTKCKVITI